MPVNVTYNSGTNTIVVTGGTSGAGCASPHDILLFDRNGTYELMAAVAPAATHYLTNQLRPSDLRAIYIDFTLAGTAAAAGDTVDVYGVDERWDYIRSNVAVGATTINVYRGNHFQVGDTLLLIDLSNPATNETVTVSAINNPTIRQSATLTIVGGGGGGGTVNAYSAYDIIGLYVTESIDVSPGNGVYRTTQRFGKIAYFNCAGPTLPGGGGTIQVQQPQWGIISEDPRVFSDYYNTNMSSHHYIFDDEDTSRYLYIDIGDGSTPTYFQDSHRGTDKMCSILTKDRTIWTVTANATMQLGDKISNDFGTGTSMLASVQGLDGGDAGIGSFQIDAYGTLLLYNLVSYLLQIEPYANSTIECINVDTSYPNQGQLVVGHGTATLARFRHVSCYNPSYLFNALNASTYDLEDIRVDNTIYHIYAFVMTADMYANRTQGTNPSTGAIRTGAMTGDLFITDSSFDDWTVLWHAGNTGTIYRRYTINIHVADPDGNDLSGVNVKLEDTNGSSIAPGGFSVTTDVNGDIAEQTVAYQEWTSATPTDYGPHTLTLSKSGYQDLVLENLDLYEMAGGDGLYGVRLHLEMPVGSAALGGIRLVQAREPKGRTPYANTWGARTVGSPIPHGIKFVPPRTRRRRVA